MFTLADLFNISNDVKESSWPIHFADLADGICKIASLSSLTAIHGDLEKRFIWNTEAIR
jgi:hypothetical protein